MNVDTGVTTVEVRYLGKVLVIVTACVVVKVCVSVTNKTNAVLVLKTKVLVVFSPTTYVEVIGPGVTVLKMSLIIIGFTVVNTKSGFEDGISGAAGVPGVFEVSGSSGFHKDTNVVGPGSGDGTGPGSGLNVGVGGAGVFTGGITTIDVATGGV
jgi:hypothetical protein